MALVAGGAIWWKRRRIKAPSATLEPLDGMTVGVWIRTKQGSYYSVEDYLRKALTDQGAVTATLSSKECEELFASGTMQGTRLKGTPKGSAALGVVHLAIIGYIEISDTQASKEYLLKVNIYTAQGRLVDRCGTTRELQRIAYSVAHEERLFQEMAQEVMNGLAAINLLDAILDV